MVSLLAHMNEIPLYAVYTARCTVRLSDLLSPCKETINCVFHMNGNVDNRAFFGNALWALTKTYKVFLPHKLIHSFSEQTSFVNLFRKLTTQ